MKTIILTTLLGTALATSAFADPVIRDLARTGSVITVHGVGDAR